MGMRRKSFLCGIGLVFFFATAPILIAQQPVEAADEAIKKKVQHTLDALAEAMLAGDAAQVKKLTEGKFRRILMEDLDGTRASEKSGQALKLTLQDVTQVGKYEVFASVEMKRVHPRRGERTEKLGLVLLRDDDGFTVSDIRESATERNLTRRAIAERLKQDFTVSVRLKDWNGIAQSLGIPLKGDNAEAAVRSWLTRNRMAWVLGVVDDPELHILSASMPTTVRQGEYHVGFKVVGGDGALRSEHTLVLVAMLQPPGHQASDAPEAEH